jgi:hypothetical protein
MQYILQEDEYKNLVPKSKIQGPIDEFLKRVIDLARPTNPYGTTWNNILEIEARALKSAYSKLESDLKGLLLLSDGQPKTEGK